MELRPRRRGGASRPEPSVRLGPLVAWLLASSGASPLDRANRVREPQGEPPPSQRAGAGPARTGRPGARFCPPPPGLGRATGVRRAPAPLPATRALEEGTPGPTTSCSLKSRPCSCPPASGLEAQLVGECVPGLSHQHCPQFGQCPLMCSTDPLPRFRRGFFDGGRGALGKPPSGRGPQTPLRPTGPPDRDLCCSDRPTVGGRSL